MFNKLNLHRIYRGLPRILLHDNSPDGWELDVYLVTFSGLERGYGTGHCWLTLDHDGFWSAMSEQEALIWI